MKLVFSNHPQIKNTKPNEIIKNKDKTIEPNKTIETNKTIQSINSDYNNRKREQSQIELNNKEIVNPFHFNMFEIINMKYSVCASCQGHK
jgi:hypothetical protein